LAELEGVHARVVGAVCRLMLIMEEDAANYSLDVVEAHMLAGGTMLYPILRRRIGYKENWMILLLVRLKNKTRIWMIERTQTQERNVDLI
jgi:hypothetical protein